MRCKRTRIEGYLDTEWRAISDGMEDWDGWWDNLG